MCVCACAEMPPLEAAAPPPPPPYAAPKTHARLTHHHPSLPPAARTAVEDGYVARDRAQEDMAQLVKHFELDRLERQKEWALYTAAIEEANNEGALDVDSGPASLSKAEEEKLRKKIRAGQFKLAKDRQILVLAQTKLARYNEALSFVRAQTGYDELSEVVDMFNKYEEEKYEKMSAISRMVRRSLLGENAPPSIP